MVLRESRNWMRECSNHDRSDVNSDNVNSDSVNNNLNNDIGSASNKVGHNYIDPGVYFDVDVDSVGFHNHHDNDTCSQRSQLHHGQ